MLLALVAAGSAPPSLAGIGRDGGGIVPRPARRAPRAACLPVFFGPHRRPSTLADRLAVSPCRESN